MLRILKPCQLSAMAILLTLTQMHAWPTPTFNGSEVLAINNLVDDLPSVEDRQYISEEDVNSTVLEVLNILEQDPTLPRLTRGEILDLYENVTNTKEISNSAEDNNEDNTEDNTEDNDDKRINRAIMLVLPFNTKNLTDANLQELYTKAPVTKMVGNITEKPIRQKTEVVAVATETPPKISEKPKQGSFMRQPSRFTTHKYLEGSKIKNDFQPPKFGMEVVEAPHFGRRRTQSSTTATPDTFVTVPNSSATVNSDSSVSETKHEQAGSPSKVHVKPGRYSSQYNAATASFFKHVENSTAAPVRQNVKDILASIGLFPIQPEPGMLTSTTVASSEVDKGAENLSPEMQDLLKTYGILQEPKKRSKVESVSTDLPVTVSDLKPGVYSKFKPLPDEDVKVSGDMESILSKFGLLPDTSRAEKSLKTSTTTESPDVVVKVMPHVDVEMFPREMSGVLQNLGMYKGRMISHTNKNSNIFNPDKQTSTNDDLERLRKLLKTIKQLERLNKTLTAADIELIAKKLDSKKDNSSKVDIHQYLGIGPDPIKENSAMNVVKNEIKRQQPNTTSETTVVIKLTTNLTDSGTADTDTSDSENSSEVDLTITTMATTSTTEEARTPSLMALEESFGAPVDQAASAAEEELPPPRKNGLYFLVDWNSFLEVGEEGRDKVNIRFDPKVGDPNRFIPVNVP